MASSEKRDAERFRFLAEHACEVKPPTWAGDPWCVIGSLVRAKSIDSQGSGIVYVYCGPTLTAAIDQAMKASKKGKP